MRQIVSRVAFLALTLSLCGCAHAPAFNILGSYFPAWMFCAITGIVFAALLRLAVIKWNLEQYAWPTILTYPCAAAFCTFSLWLLLFG